MNSSTPIDAVLDALRAHGCNPRRNGTGWSAKCPAHDDRNPSLSANEGDDGRALVHCHAGCATDAVLQALGLSAADLFADAKQPRSVTCEKRRVGREQRYEYRDEGGKLLYHQVRRDYSDGTKTIRTVYPNGEKTEERSLYRLDEVLHREPADRWVFITEGEECVEQLRREGFIATTNSHGVIKSEADARRWRRLFAQHLAGAKVVLLADNDEPGRRHREYVGGMLHGVAETVRVVDFDGLAPKGDVVDWFNNGGTAEKLKGLVGNAPEFEPLDMLTADGVRLIDAHTLTPESVRWAADGYMPLGAVTLLVARKGEGKSTIAYDKLAAATQGKLPGGLLDPVTVLIATAEDHRTQVALPRLIAAGAELERVKFITVGAAEMERGLELPGDLPDLEKHIERVRARLLFIDPLVAHMPIAIDSHKDQHVRRVLGPLAGIAERHDLAVLASIHFNKAPSLDVLTRISGSGGIANAARCILCCATDPEDESRRLFWRELSNLAPGKQGCSYRLVTRVVETDDGPVETSGVEWGDPVDVDSHRALAGPGDDEGDTIDEAREFLNDYFEAEGRTQPAAEVQAAAKRAGFSESTVKRARRKEKIKTRRHGFGAGAQYLWEAPPCRPTPPGPDGLDPHGETLTPQGDSAPQTPHVGQPPKADPHGLHGEHGDDLELAHAIPAARNSDTAEALVQRELGAKLVNDYPTPTADPAGPESPKEPVALELDGDPYGGLAGPNDPARFSR
jgi:hypothetical protein